MEKITNSAFNYTRDHDFKTAFVKYAIVSYLGDTYLSLKNNNLAHPVSDKVFWKKIANGATPSTITVNYPLGSPHNVVITFTDNSSLTLIVSIDELVAHIWTPDSGKLDTVAGEEDIIPVLNGDGQLKASTEKLSNFAKPDLIVVDTETAEVELSVESKKEYRFLFPSGLTSLALTIGEDVASDFRAKIVFKSGETAVTFALTNDSGKTIKLYGVDVDAGVFTPAASKAYSINTWFDGVYLHCQVYGV
jgi:hypothetical protein